MRRQNLGQASTSWQARPFCVLQTVLSHGIILAAVFAVPLLAALAETEWPLSVALIGPLVVCLVSAGVSRRVGVPEDLREIEAICTLVMLFLILSVLPVPALMVLGMEATDALFESISGVTSTGLTVARGTTDWPFAGHLLRGWLQWTGGFAIAVAGVVLIVGPGHAARAMGNAGVADRDILQSTRSQARELLLAYVGLTVIAIGLLVILLPSWEEGLLIALTAVSTGGFTPRPDSLASYSYTAQVVTILICLATSVSLLAYVYLRKRDWRAALRHSAAQDYAKIALAGMFLVLLVLGLTGSPSGSEVLAAVLNFLSGLSTAGFTNTQIPDVPGHVALVMVAMLIGGGVGSTAGGIKVNRVITATAMVRLTLLRFRVPSRAVTNLQEGRANVPADRVISIVAVVMCYAISMLVVWMIFLLSGQPPLSSLFDVISALSTVGLSSGVTGADMQSHLKFALMAAMLLGRLEFLALLLALSPGTWMRRR
ncbi:trk system potassium uptake protein TrkH [Roseovarius sp. MBR-154]|jgi:trk system potassium uptake protein TrkH